jgi:hypothetical protein
MNSFSAAPAGDLQDSVAAEIGIHRGCWAEAVCLVGVQHVERGAVGVGIDGDRRDAELTAGTDEAECDLAAIGDEDLAYGGHQ